MGDIWLWFVFAGMPFDVRGGSSFFFCVRCCPLGALLRNILGFLLYACVAVDTICRTHGAVTYLLVIPCFPVVRGRVFFVCGLVFLLLLRFLLSFFFFFFLTRTSRPAPMARTLLGGSELALFLSSSSWLACFWCSPLFFFFVGGARTSP